MNQYEYEYECVYIDSEGARHTVRELNRLGKMGFYPSPQSISKDSILLMRQKPQTKADLDAGPPHY